MNFLALAPRCHKLLEDNMLVLLEPALLISKSVAYRISKFFSCIIGYLVIEGVDMNHRTGGRPRDRRGLERRGHVRAAPSPRACRFYVGSNVLAETRVGRPKPCGWTSVPLFGDEGQGRGGESCGWQRPAGNWDLVSFVTFCGNWRYESESHT